MAFFLDFMAMSGVPGRSLTCMRKRNPNANAAFRTAISGLVFLDRTLRMIADLVSRVTLSMACRFYCVRLRRFLAASSYAPSRHSFSTSSDTHALTLPHAHIFAYYSQYMQNSDSMNGHEPKNIEEAKAILHRLRHSGIPQHEISLATRIHQGQVSRLLKGDFKKLQGHALELCKYANSVEVAKVTPDAGEIKRLIVDHALALWDRGSEESGLDVIKLLDALVSIVGQRGR